MNKIAAILINYNDGEHIIRSCKDLLMSSDVFWVIVVDNGSTDGSLEKIKEQRAKSKELRKRKFSVQSARNLIVLKNNQNLGFAKAANRGIKKALSLGASHVLILNPDLVLRKGFTEKLLQNRADLVQMALKFKRNGRWVYDFGGKINWALGRTYHLENNRPVNPNPLIQPDYVSGGASLIRREVFEKIGFFDEGYFMYFEDADHSLRAKRVGFTLAVDPGVIIEHKLEIVKVTRNWKKIKYNLASNFRFITKWVPGYFKPTAYGYLIFLTLKIVFNLIAK